MMGNQRRGKIFKQDNDVTKRVPLELIEIYGKLNATTFYYGIIWIKKITLIGMCCDLCNNSD